MHDRARGRGEPAVAGSASRPAGPRPDRRALLEMQRAAGNRAVQSLVRTAPLARTARPGPPPVQRFVTVDKAKIDIMFTDDVEFDVRQAAGALGLDPAVVVPLAKSWVEDRTAHGPFDDAHYWVRALWAELVPGEIAKKLQSLSYAPEAGRPNFWYPAGADSANLPHVDWKAHVGAWTINALKVLDEVLPVLGRHNVVHKVDTNRSVLEDGFKFITIYPPSTPTGWAPLVADLNKISASVPDVPGHLAVGGRGTVHMRHGQITALSVRKLCDLTGCNPAAVQSFEKLTLVNFNNAQATRVDLGALASTGPGGAGGAFRVDPLNMAGATLWLIGDVLHFVAFAARDATAGRLAALAPAILYNGAVQPDPREVANPRGVALPAGVALKPATTRARR